MSNTPPEPTTNNDMASVLAKVRELHNLYTRGDIKGPEQHEVNPGLARGSKENYIYFTLPCAVNFQRNSPSMWRSALDSYQDPATSFVFHPERVRDSDPNEVKKALIKYRLALQTNRHSDIWIRLSCTLADYYDGNPKNILAEYGFDVRRVVTGVQREKKHLFPYLSGIKLSNYWLFVIGQFTDAPLKNTHEISIIPDSHVIRSTTRLGLTTAEVSPLQVEKIWRDVLNRLSIPPTEMHSALWRWSRNGFKPSLS